MCGIAGIVRYDVDLHTQLERLGAMRARLRHRGPDGDGVHVSTHAALANTRLALLDVVGGAQPMVSPDGRYTLVYNGEVYNLDALRSELQPGWTFRTRCDTEVVLAAWATWGADCLQRLNGMFAFFIWDALTGTGFAARDLLGVKPLIYAHDGHELLFASEAKALLPVLRRPPRARLESLLEYLVAPCFSGVERPMFDGLEALQPGHALRFSRDGLSVWRWGDHRIASADGADLAARLREALETAVRRTLTADVPVGAFSSGGLDSTTLVALARRAGATPPAFTVRFSGQAQYDYTQSLIVTSDDTPFAALAAAELGLEAHVVPVDPATIAADLVTLARHNDALPAWEQELAQHHLARAAAGQVKAVLVGDAADETHYGYPFLLDSIATSSPARILERFADAPIRSDVLPRPLEHFDAKYRALAREAGHAWQTPLDRTLATTWLIVHRWLPRLLHNGDIHAMAHGLEARVPFADREVLAVASEVSPRLGLAGGVEKAVLRDAAVGLLPEVIRRRPKSALPKDQGTARLYQREATRLIEQAGDLLAPLLDLSRLRPLLLPERPLDERERALLFRVICLGHWAREYGVRVA